MSICIVQVSVRLLGDRQHLAMQRDLVRRRVFHLGGRVYGSSGGGLWRALCSRGHPSTLQRWTHGAYIWMVLLLYSCFWYVIYLWLSSSCNFWVPFWLVDCLNIWMYILFFYIDRYIKYNILPDYQNNIFQRNVYLSYTSVLFDLNLKCAVLNCLKLMMLKVCNKV